MSDAEFCIQCGNARHNRALSEHCVRWHTSSAAAVEPPRETPLSDDERAAIMDHCRTIESLPGRDQIALPVETAAKYYRRYEATITALRSALSAWTELEGRLCPEDFGFEETIASLRSALSAAQRDSDRVRARLHSLARYGLTGGMTRFSDGQWVLYNEMIAALSGGSTPRTTEP